MSFVTVEVYTELEYAPVPLVETPDAPHPTRRNAMIPTDQILRIFFILKVYEMEDGYQS